MLRYIGHDSTISVHAIKCMLILFLYVKKLLNLEDLEKNPPKYNDRMIDAGKTSIVVIRNGNDREHLVNLSSLSISPLLYSLESILETTVTYIFLLLEGS